MKKVDYKKLVKDIYARIGGKRYSRFVATNKTFTERDYHLLFTGIRIGRGFESQLQDEELQKQIPITDEELEYYRNLPEIK